VPCILLSVAAIVVSTQINHRQNTDTPQTWACKYKSLQGPKDTAQNSSNGDFGSLCSESVCPQLNLSRCSSADYV
jgi:hypothetical protein